MIWPACALRSGRPTARITKDQFRIDKGNHKQLSKRCLMAVPSLGQSLGNREPLL